MSVPYTDNEASEARQWSNRYGPPNAWTASLGTAARMIGRLLDERERLMADAMLRERARTNLDAAPAAIVPEPEPEPAARRLPAGGTGDTVHGAAPAARASVGRPRTDKADLPTRAGTGDTPDSPKPIKGGVSDSSKPINGPTPVHTPPAHATRGEGSEQRECTEPVAWGVASHFRVLATSISRMDAVDMQSDYAYHTEIVPLYRQAPDFAPPPPDSAAKAPDNAEPVAWAVCTPSDGHWSPCYFHEPHAQRCANAIVGEKNVVPLYRHPPCQDVSQKT